MRKRELFGKLRGHLSILLATCMLINQPAAAALAAEAETSEAQVDDESPTAIYDSNRMTMRGWNTSTLRPLIKEVQLNYYLYDICDDAFKGCENLEKVVIYSERFTRIGDNAFSGCKKLKTVTFDVTLIRNGSGTKVKAVTAKFDGRTLKLVNKKDFDYQEDFGNRTVTIKCKGNYIGQVVKSTEQ